MTIQAATTTGERLRAARLASGLTQARLAQAMGTRAAYISDLERGRRNAALEWLHLAATALGCDPSSLDPRLRRAE